MNKTIDINVPVLARVEGEGALDLRIEDQRITDLKLRIFEPPRFFEKFLEGRSYKDVLDTVARICGICPVAYQMSAAQAIESIFVVQETSWVQAMRKVMYCGEWLQSHSLHIHLLAAPDFLGVDSVIEMAAINAEAVRRGLRLQTLGNDLIALLGARSVHPVGMCIGGFFSAPKQTDVANLVDRLQQAKADAEAVLQWVSGFDLPDDQQDFTSVSLRHAQDYPMNGGRIISDQGLDIDISDYEQHFEEQHIAHSTALHALLDSKPYLVGPLARLNLNMDRLPPTVIEALNKTGITFPSRNMFHSIVARAVEMLYVIHSAHNILQGYQTPDNTMANVTTKAGIGFGGTEAPRGLLWHRYELDQQGKVKKARIVPPTSQNQGRMEQDLRWSLEHFGLDQASNKLRLHAEKVIRNYDPCISCATHFLTVSVNRSENIANETTPSDGSIKAKAPLRIIGIGSPLAADSLGWQVTQQLQQDTELINQSELEILYLDRPGLHLLDAMQGASTVILVDAIRADAMNGTLLEISKEKLLTQSEKLSTHQLGVAEALQFGKTLEYLPDNIVLMGLVNDDTNSIANDAHDIKRLTEKVRNRIFSI